MSTSSSISACLIVKNEEANLARCLKSLSGAVDQIIVIDTGSSDRTVEVAQEFGAEVGSFSWSDDFSAARNQALIRANGPWILWIDADEELTSDSAKVLRAATRKRDIGGYNAEIVNFTADGTDDQIYIHRAVRLFRKVSDCMFSGRIHEQVTPSLQAAGLTWADLDDFKILHHGYRPSAMIEKEKIDRTISILTSELAENPTDSFQWFNLANAYTVAHRWADAERAAAECLRQGGAKEFNTLNFQFLITALRSQAKFRQALTICAEAKASGCGGLLIDFEEALTYFEMGDAAAGLEPARAACQATWPKGMTGDRSILDSKRWLVLAQICTALCLFDEAESALASAPQHPLSSLILANILEKKGASDQALELYRLSALDAATAKQALAGAGRCAMHLGLPRQAADYFGQAWALEPSDYSLWTECVQAAELSGDLTLIQSSYELYSTQMTPTAEILVNWGRSLESGGDFEKALLLYSEAIARNPQDANAHFNAGDLLYRIGQFQDAAHIYQAALKLTPLNAQGWFVLGNSLAQCGIAEGAVIGYRQALILDPTHQEAKHNLQLVSGESA